MVNIQDLFDDAKCYQTIREMRWPDGVTCPRCSSDSIIKNGRDDTEPDRQRYECKGCRQRFDDLTDTIFAGHHQPLRTWIACLYLMGLNLSGLQIAQELDINKDDARAMIQSLRQGIVDRRPPVALEGEVECDEVYVVAGHKGHPEAVKKLGRQNLLDRSAAIGYAWDGASPGAAQCPDGPPALSRPATSTCPPSRGSAPR